MLPAIFSYCRPQFSMNTRRKMCFLHCYPRIQCSSFKRYFRSASGPNYHFESGSRKKQSMSVRVLSSGASGTPKSLLLEVAGLRYLFNCGETTERKFKDSRLNLTSLRTVLLTSLTWDNISGLPTLGLVASKIEPRPFLYVYGPKGADVMLSASEGFLNLAKTVVNFRDLNELSRIGRPGLTIQPVKIQSTDRTPCRNDLGPEWKKSGIHVHYYSPKKRIFSYSAINSQELNIERDVSIAYICRYVGKPHSPSLSISKIVKYGIPPGPLVAQLLKEEDITLPDGTILKSEEVKTDHSCTSTVIVVECPTLSYLDSLLSADEFKEFQVHKTEDLVIAHLTPSRVMKDPRYIQWMRLFPLHTKHLVVNDINLCIGQGTVLWRQNFMHLLNPQIFPKLRGVRAQNKQAPVQCDIPIFGSVHQERTVNILSKSRIIDEVEFTISGGVKDKKCENMSAEWRARWGSEATDLQLIEGRVGTMFYPSLNLIRRDQETWWNNLISQYTVNSVPKVKNIIEGIYDTYKKLGIYQEANSEEKYPQIVFLGTSASVSMRYRSLPSILLNICQDKSLMMDCGEGTLLQLMSLYEEAECQKVLCSLRAIYISHLHADHHLGLPSVLRARKAALAAAGNVSKPLLLLAPHTITDWLSLIHSHFSDILSDVTFVPLKDISIDRRSTVSSHFDNLLQRELDMQLVTTCLVRHCAFAYGVTFWHKDGWRITYSGDTMFCDALAKMGKNSDLLIHEATFENSLETMAHKKRHSTTEDGVKCGEKMQAKFTLLTHFSSRYSFLPPMDDLIMMNKSNVSISFDFMKLSLQDLPTLPLLHSAYLAMFQREIKVKRKPEKLSSKLYQATPS